MDNCLCAAYKFDPVTHVCQHFSSAAAATCATSAGADICGKKSNDAQCTCTVNSLEESTTTTSTGDPHLTFAHGARADFRGENQAWYNMLSARNVSFNVRFVHDDFLNPYKLIHGSAMKSAAWKLRTNVTGRIVTVEYNASSAVPNRALVRVSGSKVGVWVAHGGKPFSVENVRVELHEKKLSGIGKGVWHGVALIVSTGLWRTSVWNKPFPNAAANPGKALLNIHIEPLYDADHDKVAPHGLIGQSYDGDGQGVNGAVDDYTASDVVTTKAMAEGAIEGKASEYKMAGKFDIDFLYTRFDKLLAKPRDVSKLTGSRSKLTSGKTVSMSAGAGADVEDE
jgi:hypothetical protein